MLYLGDAYDKHIIPISFQEMVLRSGATRAFALAKLAQSACYR